MHDRDVRLALKGMLAAMYAGDSNTRVVEEMGIWSASARIDVAVINGEFHGYEVKSATDTLERLPTQAELYNLVFDRVTLIVAERHRQRAKAVIPRWWGIFVAVQDGRKVALRVDRVPQRNPNIDPLRLARMLWKPEALEILRRHGRDRGVRARSADEVATRLVETLSLDQLRDEVRDVLRSRAGWLGQPVSDERKVSVQAN